MKKVFFIAFTFISFSVCAQTSDAIARSNGCSDGTRAATVSGSSRLAPLNSILTNPGLSRAYKAEYQEGFRQCLAYAGRGENRGNKEIKFTDFDFTKKPKKGKFQEK